LENNMKRLSNLVALVKGYIEMYPETWFGIGTGAIALGGFFLLMGSPVVSGGLILVGAGIITVAALL
jgi:hypothetical protein